MNRTVALLVVGSLNRDQQHEKVRELAQQGVTAILFQSQSQLDAWQALDESQQKQR